MQNFNAPAARNASKNEGIDSKVSVPAGKEGKSLGNMPESPVAVGHAGGAVKGFGGAIKPGKIG